MSNGNKFLLSCACSFSLLHLDSYLEFESFLKPDAGVICQHYILEWNTCKHTITNLQNRYDAAAFENLKDFWFHLPILVVYFVASFFHVFICISLFIYVYIYFYCFSLCSNGDLVLKISIGALVVALHRRRQTPTWRLWWKYYRSPTDVGNTW